MEALKASVAAAKKQADRPDEAPAPRRSPPRRRPAAKKTAAKKSDREEDDGAQEGRRGVTLPQGYRSRAAAAGRYRRARSTCSRSPIWPTSASPIRRATRSIETWAQPWFDLAKDSLLVEAPDGAIVGLLGDRREGRHRRRVRVREDPPGSPRPGHRGLHGRRHRGPCGRADPAGVSRRRSGTASRRPTIEATALFAATRIRARPVLLAHGAAARGPRACLRPSPTASPIRPGAAGEDERISWALLEEAFAEHFGYQPFTFDEWLAMWSGFPGYDPTWVLLAFEGDEPVGISIVVPSEDGVAWVGELGVLEAVATSRDRDGAAARGRSRSSHRRGSRRSASGSTRRTRPAPPDLYERAGMTVRREYRVVELGVEGAAASG